MTVNQPSSPHSKFARLIATGQLDAGLASAAGLVAGVLAVRYLDAQELGLYGLLFAAFAIANQIPSQLVLGPAEVLIAGDDPDTRIGSLSWSLRSGAPLAALSAVFVGIGVLPFSNVMSLTDATPLILTAIAFTLISPLQDHIRRVLHIANRSSSAALVSGVHFVATAATATFLLIATEPTWVPFGALAAGNAVSVAVGLGYLKGEKVGQAPGLRELTNIGRYLLTMGVLGSVGDYIVVVVAGWILGAAAVGYAEAARLVARPVQVFGAGLSAVFGPRLLISGAEADRPRSRRLALTHIVTYLGVFAIYLLLTAFPGIWAAPAKLLPSAYAVSGLVLATLISQAIAEVAAPLRWWLLGSRKEGKLARYEVEAQLARLATLPSVGAVGIFVVPLSGAVGHVIKLVRYLLAVFADESVGTANEDPESEV